jgi:putative addiction module CopG family antidote
MNVNLGPVFDEFVAKMLKTGLYQSQSEILREGLRLLKEREELKMGRKLWQQFVANTSYGKQPGGEAIRPYGRGRT